MHRARIGLYDIARSSWKPIHKRKDCTYKEKTNNVNIIFKYVTLCIILLLGYDIQTNPGPNNSGNNSDKSSSTTVSSNTTTYTNNFIPNGNNLTMIHMNIHSIRKKVAILETEISGYDIVALTETWLNPNITNDQLTIKGYHPPLKDITPL